MKIGLDISVVQTPHRMRGIGATAINFINNLPRNESHTYVLFMYKEGGADALSILNLEDINYEIRYLHKIKRTELILPGKLHRLNGPINSIKKLLETKDGDKRVSSNDLSDLDNYISFDQMQPLPKRANLHTSVILYDLIPYVMESDYLWTYKTGRKNGDSRKSSLRKALLRKQYITQLKSVCNSATTLIAISEYTKKDFVKYLGLPKGKVKVIHLGITPQPEKAKQLKTPRFERYTKNSWGYLRKPTTIDDKPFLLFVGGADPRRKLIELITAYNHLKAQGKDIRLVLAGDTMKGPDTIPVPAVQKCLHASSYLDDILFLGFVSDEQREWLYEHALAFVYPSVYEGFGLPILEAMQYGTPVITFKNTSICEIAEDAALYAHDALSIKDKVLQLIDDSGFRTDYALAGKKQASLFSWHKTVNNILSTIKAEKR